MPLATVPLSRFLHLVLPKAPDCPRPVAEHALRMAAVEMCERARCWREVVTQTLTANGPAISTPSHAVAFDIEKAWHNGVELKPALFVDVPYAALTATSTDGTPRWITQENPGFVSVYPYGHGVLRMNLFCRPRNEQEFGQTAGDPLADTFNVVPAFIFDLHAETLAHGALARVLAMPGEPYANPEAAAVYGQGFAAALASLQAKAIRGQQGAPLRSRPIFM